MKSDLKIERLKERKKKEERYFNLNLEGASLQVSFNSFSSIGSGSEALLLVGNSLFHLPLCTTSTENHGLRCRVVHVLGDVLRDCACRERFDGAACLANAAFDSISTENYADLRTQGYAPRQNALELQLSSRDQKEHTQV